MKLLRQLCSSPPQFLGEKGGIQDQPGLILLQRCLCPAKHFFINPFSSVRIRSHLVVENVFSFEHLQADHIRPKDLKTFHLGNFLSHRAFPTSWKADRDQARYRLERRIESTSLKSFLHRYHLPERLMPNVKSQIPNEIQNPKSDVSCEDST